MTDLFSVSVPARPDVKPVKAFGAPAVLLAKHWLEREHPGQLIQIVPVELPHGAPGTSQGRGLPTPAGLPRPWHPSEGRAS